MNSLLALFVDSPTLTVVVWIVAGVTILLAGAAFVALLMRRTAAAARHLIWHLALAGAVGFAVVAPLLPGVGVRVVELPVSVSASASASASAASGTPAAIGEVSAVSAPARAEASTTMRNAPAAAREPLGTLAAIWGAGVLLVIAWWVIGRVGLARLAKRAEPLREGEWTALVELERTRFGIRAPVALLRSATVGSPVTWRARQLVVVLPDDAESWSAERRRVVLAHELAHAARGDHFSQLIACAACALYWFHPLAWIAARRLRTESERACDDQVLAQGTAGVDYAAHLLNVARSARALRAMGLVAIGMARPTQLEGRLLAVLDDTRARQAPASRTRAVAWAALAGIIVPLAAMRPAPRASERAPVALPAVTAPLSAPVVARARARSDSTFDREVGALPGGTLELDLVTGGEVDVTAWDEPKVRVRAHLAGRDWRETRLSLDRVADGATLRVTFTPGRGNLNTSTSHGFEIRVPRKFNVRLKSAGGGLSITGLDGDFSGHTGGGSLQLERVTGHASLTTGGGEILVKDSDLSGRVSTGGGTVHLSNVKGDLDGSSGSGPVIHANRIDDEARDAEGKGTGRGVGGALHISQAGGDIEIDSVPDGAVLKTAGGRIRVGSSSGSLKVSTGGGNITVGPSTGSVRATTGAGDVRITIVNGDGTEHSVDILTGTGSAVVELPADISARFDLETAYTDNFGRKTRIESDFPLRRSETTEWDTSQGSPRKYVRATGSAGAGAGKIRIQIVNGDITIRKSKP